MTLTMRPRAWFITLALLFSISLNAQNYCSHNGCSGVKCMGIIGLDEQHDSFIPPPANFDPQGERDVVISVTYNGFTPAAQTAFQYAVDIWASLITSDVPILFDATWEDISGNTLGFAGPVTFFRNFSNAPEADVYYPVALANKIAGFDLYPAEGDITASFDSGTNWYFGTDGNPGVGQYDFVTVVLHELGHGLGMTGSPSVNNGIGFYQLDDPIIYDTFVENGGGTPILNYADNSTALAGQLQSGDLFFAGASAVGGNGGVNPELYAPSSWQGGSSFSHLDESVFSVGNTNSLMTPFIAQGEAIHTPGPVILGLMEDIGWTVNETNGGLCSGLSMSIAQGPCVDTGDGLGELPVIELEFDYTGDCSVVDLCYQIDGGGYACFDLPGLGIDLVAGDLLNFNNSTPGAFYQFYFTLSDGSTSSTYSWTNGTCDGGSETICDCAGNVHDIGVLVWLGDGALDDGSYDWNGVPVFFDCQTWGYDCGDAGITDDPFGVCNGNLPPNNGCDAGDIFGCTDPTASNYNPNATIDDGSCVYDSCDNLSVVTVQGECQDTGDGLGLLPVINFTPDFTGECLVEEWCIQENNDGFVCTNLLDLGISIGAGDGLNYTNTTPGATYDFYFILTDGTVSDEYTWVNGNCANQETICDCAGTEHTVGVLVWLGDGYLDDGSYLWNEQPVDFNCATWGYDCGDGDLSGDPFGVCLGNLPPNNGCDSNVLGCTDPLATNFNPIATIDDGSCFYGDCAAGTMTLEQNCVYNEETMEIISRILVNAETIGDCFVEEVCVQEVGGTETCYNLPDFEIFIGNDENGVFITVDGPGEYVVYFTTADDISEPMTIFIDCDDAVQGCGNPFALNYSPLVEVNIEAECIYDVYICDCAGTQHSGGALVWLGDGFLDDGTYLWQDQPVDFNCATWGFDCADGGVNNDPNGVCDGNLPPNNGCDSNSCGPLGLTLSQEDCIDTGEGAGILPVIGFEFAINGDCIVEDICFIENGGEPVCFNLPTLTDPIIIEDGGTLILTNTVPGATYEFYYTTSDGSQSGVFSWVNGDCENEETICDCDGTQHTIGVLAWLGDTFLDDGSYDWNGQPVDFNCATWGFDCGDGGVNNDPNGVCDGNLPPNNGCVGEILGCTDPTALNYNAAATVNDGSCIYDNPGCTDALACNFEPEATLNDGSCNYDCYGCTDPTADNYNPEATIDNGSCTYSDLGCTDALACNFDPEAEVNDGSCNYDCYGCTDPEAVNYNADATVDNGSCIYEEIGGCIYIAACNYDPNATVDDGSCNFDCYGCTDPEATNYDPDATIENGSCVYGDIEGCTDDEACNYDEFATVDDGSCDFSCYGCTDPEATNYDAAATIDDGSCIYDIEGCTDPDATNYNPDATLDDGSCIYDCEYPTLEYTVVECSDDEDAFYFVEIVISDLGNGAPYTISNDQNGDEVTLNFTGTIQVGPFNEGENVLLTVSSDQMTNCVITSPVLSCDVAVAEMNAGAVWEVYPNPANEWLTIKGTTSETVFVDLIDVTGQLVKQVQLKTGNIENRMSVADVASGVYFIRLNYADQVVTQKVTVRH